jgi:hypothetical protein
MDRPSLHRLPACPRCRGTLLTAADRFGTYSSCLGCGFVHEWLTGPVLGLSTEVGARRWRRQPFHRKRSR